MTELVGVLETARTGTRCKFGVFCSLVANDRVGRPKCTPVGRIFGTACFDTVAVSLVFVTWSSSIGTNLVIDRDNNGGGGGGIS